MDPENVLSLTLGLLALVGVLALAGGGVYLVARARSGERPGLPWRALLRLYLYLVLVASLMVMVSGLADLVRAGLGMALGKEFSYYPAYVPAVEPFPPSPAGEPPAKPQPPNPEEQAQPREEGLNRALREGLLRGISFSLVGAMVWGAHLWARRRLEEPGEGEDLLGRGYLVLLLVLFSVVVLVSLPSALYDALRFYLLEREGIRPGAPLATALTALPFWAWYLRQAVRTLRRDRPEGTAPSPPRA